MRGKRDLLFFLTPHVALQPDELKGMSESEKAGTKAIQNAVEKGAFEDHMKGLQRGAASRDTFLSALCARGEGRG